MRNLWLMISIAFLVSVAILFGVLTLARLPSPQPAYLVFSSDRDGTWDIFRMRRDGTHVTNLTRSDVKAQAPVWSPDGAWIAFVVDNDIARIRPTGNDYSVLTQSRAQNQNLAWSPNSEWIAYEQTQRGAYNIFVMQVDGSANQQITPATSLDQFPVWSADGGWIIFQTLRRTMNNWELYRMRPDGSAAQPLTNSPAADRKPFLLPDGSILYESLARGMSHIFRLPVDGSPPVQLTNISTWNGSPTVYRDWIVFANSIAGKSDFARVRVDGSHYQQLTTDDTARSAPFTMGEWVVFSSRRDGNAEIYRMRVDGSALQNLTQHPAADSDPYPAPIIDLAWRGWVGLLALLLAVLLMMRWISVPAQNGSAPHFSADDPTPY